MTQPICFLIFQHLGVEHPGVFREFFHQDNVSITTVELDEGETIPDLEDFDALWVMGGPMDVWQEELHPWLIEEKVAIRKAVLELKMPYMGICLGHQLLASALGGEVAPGKQSEVGILDVQKTPVGINNPFLNNLPETLSTLQWHNAEVTRVPEGVDVLVQSPVCKVQSMAMDNTVFTTQFHVEITKKTVPEWNRIPAYQESLENALGENGAMELEQEVNETIDSFNQNARILYNNWKKTVFY